MTDTERTSRIRVRAANEPPGQAVRARPRNSGARAAHGPPRHTGVHLIAADVHRRLRNKILTLEFKPGMRLVEEEISAFFDAGRTPVREALLRLQGEGLVSRDRGWIVQAADLANFRMIFEARMAIEGYATRLAAQNIGPEALVRLRELIERMEGTEILPRSEINRLNRAFHQAIVAASGNRLFIELHERTQYNYWNLRLPVVFMRDQLKVSAEQHRALLHALEARDGDAAERVTREHIRTTMEIVEQALAD
jgi:DNA-binding GntR family transcriptional regulator